MIKRAFSSVTSGERSYYSFFGIGAKHTLQRRVSLVQLFFFIYRTLTGIILHDRTYFFFYLALSLSLSSFLAFQTIQIYDNKTYFAFQKHFQQKEDLYNFQANGRTKLAGNIRKYLFLLCIRRRSIRVHYLINICIQIVPDEKLFEESA